MTKPGDYAEKMTSVLWRLTAVTGVFFALSLASMSPRLAKFTVAFGGLVVAGVLYNAGSGIASTINELAGQGRVDATTGTKTDSATLLAEVKGDQPEHQFLQPQAASGKS